MASFLSRLDNQIQLQPLLKHTFYQRWQCGQISLSELQGYSKEYYPFEKEFPRFVSAIHSRCENPEYRQSLLQNLVHEEQGEKNHRALWLQFAQGLGLDTEQVESHFHSDQTEFLLRTFRKYSSSESTIEGLAALYAYEQQQPEVAGTKIQGLVEHYGVASDSALEFFRTHQKYDVEHAHTEAELLQKLCRTEALEQRALEVVADTCSALYEFLDGVERRYQAAA